MNNENDIDKRIEETFKALKDAYREKIEYERNMVALDKSVVHKKDEVYKFDLDF